MMLYKYYIPVIRYWLLTRKWLWRKVIYNTTIKGIEYKNWHRYDHRLYRYSFNMGENSKYGDVNTAIDYCLYTVIRHGDMDND